MGQYWRILDLDGWELYSMPFQGQKLPEFFWSQEVADMLDLLLVSPTAFAGWTEGMWPVPEQNASQHVLRLPCSKLLTLSPELLREIFTCIDSLRDAVFLCIIDDYLAAAGAFRVRQLLDREVAPWAGHRIICIGDYLDEAGAESLPDSVAPLATQQMADAGCRRGFYSFADRTYTRRTAVSRGWRSVAAEAEPEPEPGRWRSVVATLAEGAADARMGAGERRRLDALLAHLNALAPRMERRNVERAAVLCNVSKGEYVRGRALVRRNRRRQEEEGRGGPDLGNLLLGQICWSDERVAHFKDVEYDMMHGPWAGDQIEVTTADRLRPDIEWEDYTEYALAMMDELCENTDY